MLAQATMRSASASAIADGRNTGGDETFVWWRMGLPQLGLPPGVGATGITSCPVASARRGRLDRPSPGGEEAGATGPMRGVRAPHAHLASACKYECYKVLCVFRSRSAALLCRQDTAQALLFLP